MVSVLPATVAWAVRTVAAACWLAAGGLPACEPVAAAAVIRPPVAAAAARLMLAMMILGCRTGSSLSCALRLTCSVETVARRRGPRLGRIGPAAQTRAGHPPRRGRPPRRGPGRGPR